MANHHFYEQSVATWNREWADEGSDMEEITDEERDETEKAARYEMERADSEAADYRQREREFVASSVATEFTFDAESPF